MKVLHFCLLAMFFSCTSNVEKGEYTILDPTTFEEKELLLSDYVGTFIKYYKISQLIHTQSIAN